jgi:gamma-glutamyltranspeptidase/glutathione hydrolase
MLLLSLFAVSDTTLALPGSSKHFMVVSERREATQAGVDILKAGGNAIDAAVAVGYALAVVNPCCGNIGGGGFMMIHLASGKNTFINFREKAPALANKNMYLDKSGNVRADATTKGYLAVGVPGTVLGLDTALQKYGTMSRKQVMAPAIALAMKGYHVTAYDDKLFRKFLADFRSQPNVAKIFLDHDQLIAPGSKLVQEDLARTLLLISDKGADVFYKGKIAEEIVAASHRYGGILQLSDFASYTVEELSPLNCKYHGLTLLTAPPPSSGGVAICEMLGILERFPLSSSGFRSFATVRSIVEAMRYGFTDRNKYLGDPDFVSNPVSSLLSKSYTEKIAQEIQGSQRAPQSEVAPSLTELTDTTHYSIVDGEGNAVAVTYTLNGFFGARVIAGDTGFFLNDEMDDFAVKPGVANKFGLVQYDKNQIEPLKRPLSSMAPTIVLRDGRVFLVLGSPGGPRIISSVLLTLINVLDFGMSINQAVDAPRFHYQALPDEVSMEPLALPFLTRALLRMKGYHLQPEAYWSAVEAIAVDLASGELHGANDRRRPDGLAMGGDN